MRFMNSLFTTVCLLLLLVNGVAWAEKPVAPDKIPGMIRVDAEEAVQLIINTKDLVIIDARKDNEYSKGHIQGAISLLNTEMTLESLSFHVPDKATPLLFYCNGERCLRSSRAATKAHDWGYKLIYWFRGGWNEWLDKGMPVAR